MRVLLWFGLIATVIVIVLISCTPVDHPPMAALHDELAAKEFGHLCDSQGVCCYWKERYSSISCVATRIIVVTREEPKDERNNKSSSETGGEVTGRALEARIFSRH